MEYASIAKRKLKRHAKSVASSSFLKAAKQKLAMIARQLHYRTKTTALYVTYAIGSSKIIVVLRRICIHMIRIGNANIELFQMRLEEECLKQEKAGSLDRYLKSIKKL
jgi:hypothetical protein